MPSFGDHPMGDLDDFSKNASVDDTSGPVDDSTRVRDRGRPCMDIMNIDEGAFEEADNAMTAEGSREGSWAYAEEDEEDGTRNESMDPGMEASLRRGVYAALLQSDGERAGYYWGTASNGNSGERRTRSTTSARSALSTPSPTALSLAPSPHPSRAPSRRTREQLWTEIQRLRGLLRQQEAQISELTAQRDDAEHCWIMFQRQNAVLELRLNAMTHTRVERRFNPMLRVASAGAQAGWNTVDTARGAKEKQKRDAAQDREARRAITSTVFSGSLKTKAKAELRDIASALGLPVEGTNKVIVERIQAHLDATPALADHPRFAGLRARRT